MSGLTTHILDTARGLPASGVKITLEQSADGDWIWLANAVTDSDGRARLLQPEDNFDPGTYRLTFEVTDYFESLETLSFYPSVQITFVVRDARHHHVPLLLSPFGYSTYRGS